MPNESTLMVLLISAVLTGVIHTITGPDHYLPFIAISKCRNYGMFKTLLWTTLCGIGHVGSALLLAVLFLCFSELLSQAHIEWIEACRGDLAAYVMIGMGAALILHSLHRRWKHLPHIHKHVHADGSVQYHSHELKEEHAGDGVSYWVIFIIFVLGPCEAMFPLLTASAVLGTMSVILVSVVFSIATIATMLCAVAAGRFGLQLLRFPRLEQYAPEIAGGTVMLCGLAIVFLGL